MYHDVTRQHKQTAPLTAECRKKKSHPYRQKLFYPSTARLESGLNFTDKISLCAVLKSTPKG
jgi:hypothetical protein